MTDYLAEMRERIDGVPVLEPQQWALASIAETLAALLAEFREVFAYTPDEDTAPLLIDLTLPQGTEDTAGETTGVSAPTPSPAGPSLVALDAAEDALLGEALRWREADRIFPPESAEWWDATARFRDAIDRIELAR